MIVQSEFTKILERIAGRQAVDQSEVAPFLMASAVIDRQRNGFQLAKAHALAGRLDIATFMALRAFDIGPLDGELYTFCCDLLLAQNRMEEALTITREAILMAAESRNFAGVYAVFSKFNDLMLQWTALGLPKPEPNADRVISWVMEKTFSPPSPPALAVDVFNGRKIRIGVMLAGDQAEESALTRVALSFVHHHDRARFEVHVYSYFSIEQNAKTNPKYHQWVADIESWGCTFHEGLRGGGIERVAATRNAILSDQLDVLIFNMLIRDYYILALMRPAPGHDRRHSRQSARIQHANTRRLHHRRSAFRHGVAGLYTHDSAVDRL